MCKVHCEDIKHASFQCVRVNEIWENLGVASMLNEVCTDNTGPGVLEVILRRQDSPAPCLPGVGLKELIATACWYSWWEHRKITRDEPVQSTARSAQAIAAVVTNFVRATKSSSKIRRHGWEKPREGFVKLNIDAAFSLESETGATGAVIRDDRGSFIAASSSGLPHVADAPTAEARALRDGLILAGQVGCNKLVVMDVVDIMNSGGNSNGPAAAIFEECFFLAVNFSSISFFHCPRESNEAAHVLASRVEGNMSTVWHGDPPDFLIDVLAHDVSLFDNKVP